jgi:succinate dehydrogenase/fumarate reductase cytochrome b subunit
LNTGELDMEKIVGGAAVGGVAALIHHFIAGVVIAPIMWGSLFYGEGGLAGGIAADTVVMVIVGLVMGAIGAFLALYIGSDRSEAVV